MNDINPEHLVTLHNVYIPALRRDERDMPYFEVQNGEEILKVRVSDRAPEWIEWIETHLDKPIDLTIFPYKWELVNTPNPRSGVINYFRFAKTRSPR